MFVVNQLSLIDDNQTWEEKLEIYENQSEENDSGSEIKKKLGLQKKKKVVESESINDDSGIDYPIDIWFLLSEYIPPEAVGKFAAICKTSLAVVSTAKFWFNLYKRYNNKTINLFYLLNLFKFQLCNLPCQG